MKILKTHTALLVWRLLLLYAVLMSLRVLFYIYNSTLIGPLPDAEIGAMLKGALQFDTVSLLYANAIFVLLSLVPLHLRERGWWQSVMYWYYVVVNGVLVVGFNVADAIYFRYTQKRFSADEIFFADNDNSLQLVLKFVAENWLLTLLGVVLLVVLAFGYGRRVKPQTVFKGALYYVTSTVVLLLAVGLAIGGIRGGFTKMTRPVTLSNATLYTADNMRATMILSNPFCVLRTIGSSGKIHYERYFTEEELPAVYTPEHRPIKRNATNELASRNVVMFILESFSAEHSALLRPDIYANKEKKGYTPFLDSLMRQSYTFYNMYSNGKRSIQALPAVWSSIPSFKSPFVLMPQAMAETQALPKMLRDKGYQTMFFCGSDSGSMGFGAFARSVGIENLYSREDYEKLHGNGDFDGYWGIWDEEFIGYMGEVLSQQQQPFFSTLFTLSSHHPFVIPERYEERFKAGLTANHRCVEYVDNAFRNFFARYEGEEWFNNTIFVFVADHVSSEKFSEEFRRSPADYQVFGFIYAPESALFGEHHQVTSQIDIMPMLLGLMGNTTPYFAFGRDVFNEFGREPMAVNYDNNLFQAITDKYLVQFDEKAVTAVYAVEDINHTDNLVGKVDVSHIEQNLKAMIQSYYSHIERKDYVVDAPAADDEDMDAEE
ncbi:MAG: LTA synthase family protein [Alistipes sp.]|nr:LTA synthase family protein [Alistipes sp.]